MEAKLALSLTEQLFSNSNGRFYIDNLVSDDGGTMRSLLAHTSTHDKRRLQEWIPAITFCVDPTHPIKVMSKHSYGKVTYTKDPSKCRKLIQTGWRST